MKESAMRKQDRRDPPDRKQDKPVSPDTVMKAAPKKGSGELNEQELRRVSGGAIIRKIGG
jgi:uncharacterized membrane protein YkoI